MSVATMGIVAMSSDELRKDKQVLSKLSKRQVLSKRQEAAAC
jgi:hypothetical protein